MHLEDQPWRAEAKCRGTDLDFFYPTDGAGVLEVKEFCRDCPVKEPCGEWGIANEDFGVWGGMGERERRRLRAQRRVKRTLQKTRTRGRPAA